MGRYKDNNEDNGGMRMLSYIKSYINKSEFSKNSLVLVGGTAISQLLPILISPILTRLYTPSDFGVLALFTSITMVIAIIGNGSYELAILLPEKDSYAINIWAITVVISAILTILLTLIILIFHDIVVVYFKNPQISFWLYFVPIVVFGIASFNSFNYLFTRKKQFKLISSVRIIRMGVMSVLQLMLYFLNNGVAALISGYGIAQLSGSYRFGKEVIKDKDMLKKINPPSMIALAKRYKRFPQVTMVSSLINRVATEIPNVLITTIFNLSTLGFYALGIRLLSAPSALIGMSISQVFMQETAKEKQSTGQSIVIFDKVLKKLLLFGAIIFGIIFLTAEELFGFIFGSEWSVAGYYTKILSPYLYISFVTSTLSAILFVFEKHRIIFLIQIFLLLIIIGMFSIAYVLKIKFATFIILFSIILSLFYLGYLIILRLVAKNIL